MQIRELDVPDSYEITTEQHRDSRGSFSEWYRFDLLSEIVGHPLMLRQANVSVSARGVLRGIHFADVPRGQAKYVMVASGSIIDYVIDLRVGSPTFGRWDSVRLGSDTRGAVYLAEGLGHAFLALEPDTAVTYLVSDVYRAGAEHGVDPLDPEIGLELPIARDELVLSDKDAGAPSLGEAVAGGLLPSWDTVNAFYRQLDSGEDGQ